jgi:PIN domain nuclease of toxin-antitoxin system
VRIILDTVTFISGIANLQLRVLPSTAEHGFRLFALPTHHADPFDRQSSRRLSWKTFQS